MPKTQTNRTCPLLFISVPVSISVFCCGPFYYISFHKFSWQLSVFFLLLTLFFRRSIYLFMKVSLSPDMIRSRWLGSKHQLTNWFLASYGQHYSALFILMMTVNLRSRFFFRNVQTALFGVVHSYIVNIVTIPQCRCFLFACLFLYSLVWLDRSLLFFLLGILKFVSLKKKKKRKRLDFWLSICLIPRD